jgi:hypothetical protein
MGKIEAHSRLIRFDNSTVGASTLGVEAPFMWVRPEIYMQLMKGIIIIIGENHAPTR